jgi:hypothetical protein
VGLLGGRTVASLVGEKEEVGIGEEGRSGKRWDWRRKRPGLFGPGFYLLPL